MPYKLWQVVYVIISLTIAWLVNPATFGLGLTDNIPLNIGIRGIIFLIVLSILSKFNKPKKEN